MGTHVIAGSKMAGPRAALMLMCTALAIVGSSDHCSAQSRLDAAYTITFARIRVGDITATAVFGDSEYTISAQAHAGGIMKVLVEGEGAFATGGAIKNGRPVAAHFTSKIVSNATTFDVKMVLDEGAVQELVVKPPAPASGIIPVSEANRRGIIDPLTAMLSSVRPGEGLSQEACQRTLPIFDGRERYDLKLAFKRTDNVAAEKGYAGPVVVCSVHYEPIAGHRASAPLVKYLSESREMEVALAPAVGIHLLVPFRLSAASRIANLVIEASRFETTGQSEAVADPKAQNAERN
jgi:hypothetical protein